MHYMSFVSHQPIQFRKALIKIKWTQIVGVSSCTMYHAYKTKICFLTNWSSTFVIKTQKNMYDIYIFKSKEASTLVYLIVNS
jgi:hypothetical protein